MVPDSIADGRVRMAPAFERRLHRTIAAGHRGNMLRAVAFADPGGPARWGFTDALPLGSATPERPASAG